jgi:hypothetical protein
VQQIGERLGSRQLHFGHMAIGGGHSRLVQPLVEGFDFADHLLLQCRALRRYVGAMHYYSVTLT